MPTPDIFHFDPSELAAYDSATIDKILIEQPALYINHLCIARSLVGWADRLATGKYSTGPVADDRYVQGHVKALRDVAAHLRQGDYVEGGPMIREA